MEETVRSTAPAPHHLGDTMYLAMHDMHRLWISHLFECKLPKATSRAKDHGDMATDRSVHLVPPDRVRDTNDKDKV